MSSSVDALIRFNTDISGAFARREYLVCVFFDMTKAYDTTWWRGILNVIYDIGIGGPMAFFIVIFCAADAFVHEWDESFWTPIRRMRESHKKVSCHAHSSHLLLILLRLTYPEISKAPCTSTIWWYTQPQTTYHLLNADYNMPSTASPPGYPTMDLPFLKIKLLLFTLIENEDTLNHISL